MSTDPLRSVLRGMARQRHLVVVECVDLVILAVLGLSLVWHFGPLGIGWATAIAAMASAGLVLPWYACATLEYPLGRYWADCGCMRYKRPHQQ